MRRRVSWCHRGKHDPTDRGPSVRDVTIAVGSWDQARYRIVYVNGRAIVMRWSEQWCQWFPVPGKE